MTHRYFLVEVPREEGAPYALAKELSPSDDDYDRWLYDRAMAGGWIDDWPVSEYFLEPFDDDHHLIDGGFTDFQPAMGSLRMCSAQMRRVLDEMAAPIDVVQWLPAWVTGAQGDHRQYWVLHFPTRLDVVCYDPTEHPSGTMGPIIFRDRVGDRQVFASPDGRRHNFAVTDPVRRALLDAGCQHLEFTEISRVYDTAPPDLPPPGTPPNWQANRFVPLPHTMDWGPDGVPR